MVHYLYTCIIIVVVVVVVIRIIIKPTSKLWLRHPPKLQDLAQKDQERPDISGPENNDRARE